MAPGMSLTVGPSKTAPITKSYLVPKHLSTTSVSSGVSNHSSPNSYKQTKNSVNKIEFFKKKILDSLLVFL